MIINDFIALLQQQLQKPLPGANAQNKMAPAIRNFQNNSDKSIARKSAVLLLLYKKNDILNIAYFKRPEYDGPHSGQIAFPGGKFENTDKNLQETALRETLEEFGISPQKIQILGSLTNLFIPVSNSEVTPFVGFMSETPHFIPNKDEVQYIIEIELSLITNPSFKTSRLKERRGLEIETPMYTFNNEEIWGATAMITSEFEEIINSINFHI